MNIHKSLICIRPYERSPLFVPAIILGPATILSPISPSPNAHPTMTSMMHNTAITIEY